MSLRLSWCKTSSRSSSPYRSDPPPGFLFSLTEPTRMSLEDRGVFRLAGALGTRSRLHGPEWWGWW